MVGLGQKGVARVSGELPKIPLNGVWNRKEEGETKILKRGQAGSRGGYLGKGGSWNPLTNYANLKNNFTVSRSSYLYGVNRKFSQANAFFPYKKYNQKLHVKYYDGK